MPSSLRWSSVSAGVPASKRFQAFRESLSTALQRVPKRSEATAEPFVVADQSEFEIERMSDVKAIVRAAEDIDDVRHTIRRASVMPGEVSMFPGIQRRCVRKSQRNGFFEDERMSFDSALRASLRTPFDVTRSRTRPAMSEPRTTRAASRMVEAPGFAPGSENTSPQESTMRIRF